MRVHAPSLHRLMRTLASLGLLTERTEQRFALTTLGEALKTGAPGSARSAFEIAPNLILNALSARRSKTKEAGGAKSSQGRDRFGHCYSTPVTGLANGNPTRQCGHGDRDSYRRRHCKSADLQSIHQREALGFTATSLRCHPSRTGSRRPNHSWREQIHCFGRRDYFESKYFADDIKKIGEHMKVARDRFSDDYLIFSDDFVRIFEAFLGERDDADPNVAGHNEHLRRRSVITKYRPLLLAQARSEMKIRPRWWRFHN
jgi:hypothetical protein